MNELFHYGTPRHSGRYPWGSGENPYHHKGRSAGTSLSVRVGPSGYRRRTKTVRVRSASNSDSTSTSTKSTFDMKKVAAAKDVANQSENTIRGIKRILNKTEKHERMDLSNMTDQQLRDRINRENLEIQYDRMFNKEVKSKGRQRVEQILDVAGDIAAVGGSALAIALSIKALKG